MVQVEDSNGGTDTATVTVTVTNVDEGVASFNVTSSGDLSDDQLLVGLNFDFDS